MDCNARISRQSAPAQNPFGLALRITKRAVKRTPRSEVEAALKAILATPETYAGDPTWGELAAAVIKERDRPYWIEREAPAPYRIWGEGLEKGALDQIAYARSALVDPALTPGVEFFAFLRKLTTDGFYTSAIGIKDLQYIGNTFLKEFPGCPTPPEV